MIEEQFEGDFGMFDVFSVVVGVIYFWVMTDCVSVGVIVKYVIETIVEVI